MSSLGKLVGRVREQLSEIGEAIAGNAPDLLLQCTVRRGAAGGRGRARARSRA